MEQMVAALLAWAAWQMGEPPPPPPRVAFVPQAEVAERRYGDASAGGGRRVMAVYDRGTATIYLPMGWEGGELLDRSVLLHELVHHVQAVRRVPAVCPAQWEEQAYAPQARWLEAQGVPEPYAAMGVDRLTVKVRSMCGRH